MEVFSTKEKFHLTEIWNGLQKKSKALMVVVSDNPSQSVVSFLGQSREHSG